MDDLVSTASQDWQDVLELKINYTGRVRARQQRHSAFAMFTPSCKQSQSESELGKVDQTLALRQLV